MEEDVPTWLATALWGCTHCRKSRLGCAKNPLLAVSGKVESFADGPGWCKAALPGLHSAGAADPHSPIAKKRSLAQNGRAGVDLI